MDIKKYKVVVIAIITFILGVFLGMEYKAFQIREVLSNTNYTTNTSTDLSAEEKKESKPILVQKEIGEEGVVNGVSFKVNSFKETTILTAKYGSPKSAKTGTKYVIVNMTVKNNANSSTSFQDENFLIIDDNKREFKVNIDTIGGVDDYLLSRELAPSIPESGNLVYQIPEDLNYYSVFAYDENGAYFVFNQKQSS